MAASLPWAACSSSPNGPRDGATSDAIASDAETNDTNDTDVPDSPCNGPLSRPSTLRGVGFEAWEGLAALGCLNSADPLFASACDDATVTGGTFTVTQTVCTGVGWDFHIFDGYRGLDCITTGAAIDGVFTITPADCACFSPGRVPSTGCGGEVDGGADGDAGQDTVNDAPDGS